MKMIILAAGRGKRIMPLTRNTPKPLLKLGNGYTLLEEQINRIIESSVIDEIVLVVGYCGDQIEAKLKTFQPEGVEIKTIFNPFYDVSNNLHSLWMAKHAMNDNFLITNGDNLIASDVYKRFVKENGKGIFLSINTKNDYDKDDMKVKLDDNGVIKVSKEISPAQSDAESPGLVLVKGSKGRKAFRNSLEELARKREYRDKYWLEVFNNLSSKGINVASWEFNGDEKWQEVDFHMDLQKARDLLEVSVTDSDTRKTNNS